MSSQKTELEFNVIFHPRWQSIQINHTAKHVCPTLRYVIIGGERALSWSSDVKKKTTSESYICINNGFRPDYLNTSCVTCSLLKIRKKEITHHFERLGIKTRKEQSLLGKRKHMD